MNTRSGINFVKKDQRLLKLQTNRIYIIQTASMFVLGVYVLVMILTFSYSTFLSYQNRMTSKQIERETAEIEKLTPIEAKYLILKQKAEAAVTTTKSMYQYQDLMQALFELVPSDLAVDGFAVDEENNVTFAAKTANASTIDDFIARVKQYNSTVADSQLVKASISSVSVDKEGFYTLNVKLYVEFEKAS